MKCISVLVVCAFILFVPLLAAQAPAAPMDPTAVWNALESPTMDTAKAATVDNVEIVRDRLHIILKSGTIQFAQPVNSIVFAAVFHGEGSIQCVPPNPIEAQQLRLFTKQAKLDVAFDQATFSFTDGLLDEVAKQVHWTAGGTSDDLYKKRQQDRENLGAAYLPRLFQSVLSADRRNTAYFLADLHTKEKGWVEVADEAAEQEEISVGRWVPFFQDTPMSLNIAPVKAFDLWMSFPAAGRPSAEAWRDPQAKADFLIRAFKIDATVTGNPELHADARVTLDPKLPGERVLLFRLDSNLRLESVVDAQDKPLVFFQARENKDRYQSYGDYVAVVLPSPFPLGQAQILEFRYGGKRAIRREGTGNYFCESSGWYPDRLNPFTSRADFELAFRAPKSFVLVATGDKINETQDGNTITTTWKSAIPLSVAGFAFGDYEVYTTQAGSVAIDVYANREPDDYLLRVQRAFERGHYQRGLISASDMAANMGTEMADTVRVFEYYFGPYPYKRLSVISMPFRYAYGTGLPGLVSLWSGSFLNPGQLNAIGLKDQLQFTDLFRAHESSHQWWGARVGWKSYHDVWLSEGFADFSGILYVQYRKSLTEALSRWRMENEHLRNKDKKGHAIESLGPIWLGQRIASSETDRDSYENLVYSKGAIVLQMLRMMLFDTRNPNPDHRFMDMMQDYCKTFDNQPASTEDFKAIVEKHMLPPMSMDGKQTMDWFFDQYVYGTGIPHYVFSYALDPPVNGKTKVMLTLKRTGVPDNWKDLIPIYAHSGDKVVRIAFLRALHPNMTTEVTVSGAFDKLTINDSEDLLADIMQ